MKKTCTSVEAHAHTYTSIITTQCEVSFPPDSAPMPWRPSGRHQKYFNHGEVPLSRNQNLKMFAMPVYNGRGYITTLAQT